MSDEAGARPEPAGQAPHAREGDPPDLLLDLRRWRGDWLSGWRELVDGYLRSPQFLQLMQHNIDVLNRTTRFFFPFRF